MTEMRTPRVLAEQFGVKVDQVLYVIRSRAIEPATVVGGYRVFDSYGVELVRSALEKIADRRRGGSTSTA